MPLAEDASTRLRRSTGSCASSALRGRELPSRARRLRDDRPTPRGRRGRSNEPQPAPTARSQNWRDRGSQTAGLNGPRVSSGRRLLPFRRPARAPPRGDFAVSLSGTSGGLRRTVDQCSLGRQGTAGAAPRIMLLPPTEAAGAAHDRCRPIRERTRHQGDACLLRPSGSVGLVQARGADWGCGRHALVVVDEIFVVWVGFLMRS